ncbi:MAG: hypothetical protein IOMNBAOH_00330 [Rhodocyclaceae bacterium]|nr:hypothetical protein [Rhodocyclaceae bacterium]
MAKFARFAGASDADNGKEEFIMKKKYLAVAVAAACGAPALALAQSNVTIYGRMNMGFDRYSATGATAGSAADVEGRARVIDSSSRIGFRGVEDLGNGLKAVFQIESGFNADASAGAVGASTGTLGTRPTFVGLQGNWGRVLLGRQDVWWGNGKMDVVYYGKVPNGFINGLYGPGNSVAAGATGDARVAATFARADNVVTYETPNFNGFTGKIQYLIPTGESTVAGSSVKNTGWNVTGTYDNGPLYLQVDFMRNDDTALTWDGSTALTANGNKVEAWKLGGRYLFPTNTEVMLYWTQVKADSALINQSRDRDTWVATVSQFFGPHNIALSYGRTGDVSGWTTGSETGATHTGLGYFYSLSKRTTLQAWWTKIKNDSNAGYQFISFNGAGAGTNSTPFGAVGADPTSYGVGIAHNF